MMDAANTQITLTIRGSRAQRGVSLSDFESFVDSFLAALRDYDRADRGQPTRTSGHPNRRAEAVTAFTLVGFQTGSGVATIEPEFLADDDETLATSDAPLSLLTLQALADDLASERTLPPPVLEALGKACRAVGADGSLSIDLPGRDAGAVVIDRALLDRVAISDRVAPPEQVNTISGRLHLLDVDPDRLGIHTATGAEWSCRYPDTLENQVKGLVGRIVWATGQGQITTAGRGTMDIERIHAVDFEQSELFTTTPVEIDELLAHQHISSPQGLQTFADPAWDDETDEAYLATLLAK